MNADEYGEVLRHARRTLRDLGLGEIDSALLGRLVDAPGARGQLLAYLRGFADEISFTSTAANSQLMGRLGEVATDSGVPISSVVVEVQETDRARLGVDEITLVGSTEIDQILQDLEALIEEITTDIEGF